MSRVTMTEGEGKGEGGGDVENAKGSRYPRWFRTREIRFGLFGRVRNKIATTFATLRLIKLKAEAVIPFQLPALWIRLFRKHMEYPFRPRAVPLDAFCSITQSSHADNNSVRYPI